MNLWAHETSEETKKTLFKKTLFKKAKESKWDEVIKIYEENPSAHTDKITSSGDTALHIAVSNGKADIVKALVNAARETTGALEAINELGNTPLHLAAYLGDARMCRCIAEQNRALMGIRNNDNETPFFLAVRHGRKEAFHALHFLCKDGEGYKYCRGKGGETILHSAILGEYFELAYYIMEHYKNLLDAVNEQGFSPLHLLANKPSAFRSGSHIRGIHKLIYHCIFVDELHPKMTIAAADLEHKPRETYPKNYSTCVATFNLFTYVMRVLLGHSKDNHDEEEAETPKDHQQNEEHANGLVNKLMIVLCGNREANAERFQFEDDKQQAATARSSKRSAQGHEFFPKNYNTFFKFISKATLVVLGLVSEAVENIREKKAKHIWSIHIMNELLEQASSYQYEYNGKSADITILSAGKPTPYTLPDSAGEVGFNPTMVDRDILEEPTPEQDKGTERNQSNNKAEGDKKPCGECRELLCSLLTSLGLVKHSAPLIAQGKGDSTLDMEKKETPILIAAKNGVVEMVEGILSRIPVAMHDMNSEEKNVVLLAVEHRQPHVYKFLLDWKKTDETIFRKTDKDGNSALHLAARLGEYRPAFLPGEALQMQWEIKWYEFVRDSMPQHFFPRHNRASQTPTDIFNETHGVLAKEGGKWLTNTSQIGGGVVAALIATVAFTTSTAIPGGVKSDNSGTPTLQDQPAFSIFAISSLVALCFSVTSIFMFFAILTSRFEQKDFGADLPRKLLVGLTSLFISIESMLLSFCAGHFFVLNEKLQYGAFPMYAITCLFPFFAAVQFPLYFDLIWATIRKVPQRNSK